ncbi:MAG: DUF695 domain-containing protein [Candidatus Obscuribacterales bacterium]|nr:DUF695 domain-containing protein [Candidatus Obscuribacterales bacterium]
MHSYQQSLFDAFEKLRTGDYSTANSQARQFLTVLQTDLTVQKIRDQHEMRQLFEADFLSVLTTDELDAWSVITHCEQKNGDGAAAEQGALTQLRLIDEFYGFESPSYLCPEVRTPQHHQLAKFFGLAGNVMATILANRNEDEKARRWLNATKATAPDQESADQVWLSWVSGANAPSVPRTDWADWTRVSAIIDGKATVTQLYKSLSKHISPVHHKWLLTVMFETIPTTGLTPAKSTRWKMWGVRQAIWSRLACENAGMLALESQQHSCRRMYFYVNNPDMAETIVQEVLQSANLPADYTVEDDLGWNTYTNHGGSLVLIDRPDETEIPKANTDRDTILRRTWLLSTSRIHDAWERFYSLLSILNRVQPESEPLREYCVNQLFDLVKQLGEKRLLGWAHMVKLLPVVDKQSAIHAFGELWSYRPFEKNDFPLLCSAAEELAIADPSLAAKLLDEMGDYELVPKARARIAKEMTLATHDKQIILDELNARLRVCSPTQRVELVIDMLNSTQRLPANVVKNLLIESLAAARLIDSRMHRLDALRKLANEAARSAPDLIPEICEEATQTCIALELTENTDWMDPGGAKLAASGYASTARIAATCNRTQAVTLLVQAMKVASGSWENVTEIASVIAECGLRDEPQLQTAFAKLIVSCEIEKALPEYRVALCCRLCTALSNDPAFGGPAMLELAEDSVSKCSSAYLRSIAAAQLSSTRRLLQMDYRSSYSAMLTSFDQIAAPRTRAEALLESAECFQNVDAALVQQIFDNFKNLVSGDASSVGDLLLKGNSKLPRLMSAALILDQLEMRSDEKVGSDLVQWINRFDTA